MISSQNGDIASLTENSSSMNSLLKRINIIDLHMFRVSFNSTTNRITLEFWKTNTEIYYLGINIVTKEIILDSSINDIYTRIWTIN